MCDSPSLTAGRRTTGGSGTLDGAVRRADFPPAPDQRRTRRVLAVAAGLIALVQPVETDEHHLSVGFGRTERGSEADAAVTGGAGVGDVLAMGSQQREEATDVCEMAQVHGLVPAGQPHRQQRPGSRVRPAAYDHVGFRVRAGALLRIEERAVGRRRGLRAEDGLVGVVLGPVPAELCEVGSHYRGAEDGACAPPDLVGVLLLQGRALGPDGCVFEGEQWLCDSQPDRSRPEGVGLPVQQAARLQERQTA
ncbi:MULTISPECIES: hypothetical protein [Streptomyces]|uniref:hypothetical protein n=1 Tax=Streptomyces TaxID=1883 RepID=UPI00073DEDC8|nr:hypothetical protein [Streptomyces sp. EAS-AB2608]BCM72892.1 hypothetical protein EASAB2608_08226 [Streptomyces sp. EAS-AB2608]CUW33174.1 hypothetical protein TUE45_pSRTUE45c_0542 [Streptomyces reticuli]